MRCEQVERLLIDYLEGELGATEAAAVREHLAACGACAAEEAAFESTRELLRNDAYTEPSPFYWTRFDARLRERMRRRSIWAGADDRWGALVPRLAPVAVAALCFAVGMWVGLSPPGSVDGTVGGPRTPGYGVSLAEGPVVSPRSKALVESGSAAAEFAYAADTLAPFSYEPPTERSEMMLASSDEETEFEQRLVHRLLRD
jgi:anti-sigma factor RsiW